MHIMVVQQHVCTSRSYNNVYALIMALIIYALIVQQHVCTDNGSQRGFKPINRINIDVPITRMSAALGKQHLEIERKP